jgi:hypothetical protein
VRSADEPGTSSPNTAHAAGSGETAITSTVPPTEEDREGSFELHEMAYGGGGFFPLDSDDIDEMIRQGQV